MMTDEEKEQYIKEFHEDEDREEANDSYYSDWFDDNKHNLKNDFVDEYEDLFAQYCREQFKDFRIER